MVNNISLENFDNFVDNSTVINSCGFNSQNSSNAQDLSVFDSDKSFNNKFIKNSCDDVLETQLDSVMDKQGVLSKGWNDFKKLTNIGISSEDCQEIIDKYKSGEMSFEEASSKIQEFDKKQDSSLNLFSNIATSIVAIAAIGAVTLATGGIGVGAAIAIGAGAGALTKAGIKAIDKATNEVKGDAGNIKDIAKDALSGAVTGGLATWTMGTAGSAGCVTEAVTNCAITGVKSGAISGAANYSIDCTFDKNKDFDLEEFVGTTAANAAVGAAVGAAMGGINGGLRANGLLKYGCGLKDMVSNQAGIKDIAANSVCTADYKILNDRIKSVI